MLEENSSAFVEVTHVTWPLEIMSLWCLMNATRSGHVP